MFNEILTGKATNEPPPHVGEPYRAGSIPQIKLTCIGCAKTYSANTGTPPGHCPTCNLEIAQARTAEATRAAREVEERFAKRDSSNRMVKWAVFAVIGIGLAFAKGALRTERRDAAARAAGYTDYAEYESLKNEVYPSDEYSYTVQRFANDACYCKDLACTRNIQAQYSQYTRRNSPSDDMSRASAAKDSERLFDCAAALETSTER